MPRNDCKQKTGKAKSHANLAAEIAEARRLLGQALAISIQSARAEQLIGIAGAGNEAAKEVARYIEACDTWCAEYDRDRA